MITNRQLPHIVDLIEGLPEKYKSDVIALLDELENSFPAGLNTEYLGFSKYKVRVAGGEAEVIIEAGFLNNIRIVDIKTRTNIKGILRKIGRVIDKIDIAPKG
jgi:hypothetical protein